MYKDAVLRWMETRSAKGMNQIDDGANQKKKNCHKSQKIKVDRRITITKTEYVNTATREIPLPFLFSANVRQPSIVFGGWWRWVTMDL